MIVVLQRVSRASVRVEGRECGAIGAGILSMLAFERGDGAAEAALMVGRVLACRLFDDGSGRLGLSLQDLKDLGLLLVPQFTLAADTAKGNRPNFFTGAGASGGCQALRAGGGGGALSSAGQNSGQRCFRCPHGGRIDQRRPSDPDLPKRLAKTGRAFDRPAQTQHFESCGACPQRPLSGPPAILVRGVEIKANRNPCQLHPPSALGSGHKTPRLFHHSKHPADAAAAPAPSLWRCGSG